MLRIRPGANRERTRRRPGGAAIGGSRRVLNGWAAGLGALGAEALRRQTGQDGRLARTWPTRSMALWVLVLLLGYLLLYYT